MRIVIFYRNCYLGEEGFAIPKAVHVLFWALRMVGKEWIDRLVSWDISAKLDQVTEEHRIEAIIHILRGLYH